MAQGIVAGAALAAAVLPVGAQPAGGGGDLARHFGFDAMRIVVVDEGCGPVVAADFNGDGRPDLAVANNRKSRIEVHLLRAAERTEAERERAAKANELPPSPWYDRVDVSVPHRVTALRAYDADRDGKIDLVYAGSNPSELVVLRQEAPSRFAVLSKREVKGLSARQRGLVIADVLGDASPEVLALADDRIEAYALSAGGVIGEPARVGTAAAYAALFVEDFDGDGLNDLLAVVPEDAMPVRLWLQRQDPRAGTKSGLLASEQRFEMPALREVEPVRFPGRAPASIGVIERASRRIVFYDLVTRPIETGPTSSSSRQVRASVWAFTDGTSKDRSVAVTDLDGDGRLDLLATDSKSNTVALYRQAAQVGLGGAEQFSAFKKPKSIAVGRWDAPGGPADSADRPEVFVLSEEEKAVGVSRYDAKTGRLQFPVPIALKTAGASPVAMEYVTLDGVGMLAVIVKDRRDHTLELHRPGGDAVTLELKGVSRPPQSMLAADASQDGRTDLLLFTPGEPMVMVRSASAPAGGAAGGAGAGSGYEVLTDKQMPQFGLVQAATSGNTALLDVDGDGKPELLIADDNYVRACRYDPTAGWRVVDQFTLPEPGTKFTGLATLAMDGAETVVVADKGNGRLLLLGRESGSWKVRAQHRLLGFPLGTIFAGSFGGDGQPSVLCIADEGFALVRLAGQRLELESFAAYRSESDDRSEHELEVGDLNSDGYVDVVALDAGERMCELFTFSAARRLHPAMEFEVFQSRLFSRGQARESEPRAALVADLTGDGRDDLLLVAHDRLIIYPQATRR
jgi:hypothetical protein